MLKPITPVIRGLILKALREEPAKSYARIAQDWGVGERTVRSFAKQAGITRKPGVKPWHLRVHPREWTPAQRRIAFQAARILEGLAREAEAMAAGLPDPNPEPGHVSMIAHKIPSPDWEKQTPPLPGEDEL